MVNRMLCRTEQLPAALTACRLAGVTPCVVGMSGIGKSQIIEQLSEQIKLSLEEDFGLIFNILSLVDSVELRGIGFPVKKTGTVKYFLPEDTPFEGNEFVPEKGWRFNDELDRAGIATMHAFIPQLTSRKIGNIPIKSGWWDVCAINGRAVDDTANDMPIPLRLRMCFIYFHPSHTGLIKYARANRWNSLILGALEDEGVSAIPEAPDFEDYAVIYKRDGTEQPPSPRQRERASDLMNVIDANPVLEPVRLIVLQGMLGFRYACELAVRLITAGQVPTAAQISSHGASAPIPDRGREHLMAMVFSMFANTTHMRNPDNAITYLERCYQSGMNPDIVRLGINAISQIEPRVWNRQWALEIAS